MKCEIPEYEFPVAGENLLGDDGDWRSSAYVQPPGQDTLAGWLQYIGGFRRSSELMAERVRSERDLDGLVFPLVFSYRHQCELSLKAIIVVGTELLHLPRTKFPGGHFLQKLWPEARRIIELCHIDSDPVIFQTVGDLLAELSSIDRGSTAFRYPVGADGEKPSHAVSLQSVNLDQFCRVATKLCGFLYCTAHGLLCDLARQQAGDAEARVAEVDLMADAFC
jgi:hypothetical protein